MNCVVCGSQVSDFFSIKGGSKVTCCPECRSKLAFHIFKRERKARSINKLLKGIIIALLIVLAFTLGKYLG